MKRPFLASVAIAILIRSAFAGPAEPSPWTLSLSPTFSLPLTAGDFTGNDMFDSAWGGFLSAEYALPSSFPLALRLGLAYSEGGLLDVAGITVEGRLSEATLLAGASAGVPLASKVCLLGYIDAGLSYGMLSSGVSYPYAAARAGAGVDLSLTSSLTARLDASFLYKAGLYGGLGLSLGMGYRLPEATAPANLKLLEVESLALGSVFPIFRSYYDDNPIGTVTITNTGRTAATDVRVSFVIRQYMDAAKECAVVPRIEAGKSVTIPLYGLFHDGILGVTEATKSTAEVLVEYGAGATASRTATVLVYDRNALTWDDDRHAAAFVSSKDPWVLGLVGNMIAATKDARNAEVSENLQAGIAFHEGLRAYGMGYVLSPSRPFASATTDLATVDSLKFPRQTLGYRSGDCADLSVLYASFFEAAAIETAFVTVPGHIFMAFDLGLSPDEARARGMDERELIVKDGRAWVPVETTLRSAGFVEAWRSGATQWREANALGQAAFYPVHDAWKTYPPVGLPADGSTTTPPAAAKVLAAFKAELSRIVAAGLQTRLDRLGPKPTTDAARYLNNRGILYARYGMYAEAERDFASAARDQFLPAIINLGNVAFLKEDYAAAYRSFTQALRLSPDNARLLVCVARAAAALGRADEAAETLERARKLDPTIAEQYAPSTKAAESATRAAEAGTAETLWF